MSDFNKWSTLIVLTLQNAGLSMVMRYSRISTTESERYIASTAVVVAEIIKLAISLTVFYTMDCEWRWHSFYHQLHREVFYGYMDALKLLIPSGIYVFQNNLLYIASSNLPAAVLQVLSQMKIITTAILAELILGKKHSTAQRLAVVALACGVTLVQQSSASASSSSSTTGSSGAAVDLTSGGDSGMPTQNILTGVICITIACVTSGFAGVYFELVLKSSNTSIWLRNIEMAVIGVLISLPTAFIYDSEAISEHGFFHGYNNIVWLVIMLSAGGGLVVALVVKYADNVLKGFATSASIVISVMFSAVYLQETSLTYPFLLGAATVCVAAYIYGTMPLAPQSQGVSPVNSSHKLMSLSPSNKNGNSV